MVTRNFYHTDNSGVLCEEEPYSVVFFYEEVHLAWEDGAIDLGSHYGYANCGIMDAEQGWCVTAGSGLIITRFARGFPGKGKPIADFPYETHNLWSPAPDGRDTWFVEGLWWRSTELDEAGRPASVLVRALVEPASDRAGLYEIDLVSLAFRRL
jgi:hypothetical protein